MKTETPDVNPVAEPSAATPAAPATAAQPTFDPADQYTWTAEQRTEWNKSGKQPESPANKEEAAASGKSKQDNSGAEHDSAEAAPATEAGKTQEKKGKLSAKERGAQLDVEIADLEAKLEKRAQLRRQLTDDGKPAESSTAKPAEQPKALEAPKKPSMADYDGSPGKTWEDFEAAKDKYFEDLADHKAKVAVAEARKADQENAQRQKVENEFTEGRKRYPDFDTKVKPVLDAFTSDPQFAQSIAASIVGNSPVFVDLMYVIGSDPNELASFMHLAKADPHAAIRKAVLLEQLTMQELDKKTGTTTARDESGKFTTPANEKDKTPVEPQPRAPKPPSEVGGRGAAPDDALVTAAKANDFRSFDAEQTRRARASRS